MPKLTIDLTKRLDGDGKEIPEADVLVEELTNIAALEQVGRADEIRGVEREFIYSDPRIEAILSPDNTSQSFDRGVFLVRSLRSKGAVLTARRA